MQNNFTKCAVLLTLLFQFQSAFADHLSQSLQFTARMTGAQEVPPVTTSAEGLGVFTLSEDKTSLDVNISVAELSGPITGIHIHEGMSGENGDVVHNLSDFIEGNRIKTQIKDIDISKFLAGMYYLNVHTEANPGGEIRAQIILETDTQFAGLLLGSNEVPAVSSEASGICIANLGKSGYKLTVNAVFPGLSSPVTGAHFHLAAAGENGDVVENLTGSVNGVMINAEVNPTAYLSALRAGIIYLNVHTEMFPDGELRAQLMADGSLYFDASLDAAQEVPALDGTGAGLAMFSVSQDLKSMTYNVSTAALSGPVTAAHLHLAEAGSNGDVVVDLSDNIDGNSISGTVEDLPVELLNCMLRGNVYLNIHTDANPSGEIRGQVYKLAREAYTYEIGGGFEVPPTESNGSGVGMVTIDRDQSNAHFMMVVSGLEEPIDAAHFHNALPGQNGDVVYNLTPYLTEAGGIYGYWTEQDPETPFANSLQFRRNEIYVNVHTDTYPGGAIRGNSIRSRDLFENLPLDPNFSSDLFWSVKLTGGNEVPPVTTNAVGIASLIIDEDRSTAVFNASFNGLSGPITGAHIHQGNAEENGDVVFNLSDGIVGNRIQFDIVDISEEQFSALLSGAYYINVHTDENPGGEVRAQMILEKDDSYIGLADGGQEVPAVDTDATGMISLHHTKVLNTLEVNAIVAGLSGPITGAHLHNAPSGENGDVVQDLSGFVRGNTISVTIPAGDYLTELRAGALYLNIHTEANPNGEIRAQLNFENNLVFDAWLTGAQEVPAATTSASGMALTILSNDMAELNVFSIVDGLSSEIAAAHLHNAAIGANGDVLVDLSPAVVGNSIRETVEDPSIELINGLLLGKVYLNVHTAGFPGGEVRGNLLRLARDGYGFDLCSEQETHDVTFNTDAVNPAGAAIVSLDRKLSNAHIMVVSSNLTSAFAGAHIHQAAESQDGDVIYNLSDFFDNGSMFVYVGSNEGFTKNIAEVVQSGNTYINVHTENNPAGEIRGQIVRDSNCDIFATDVGLNEINSINDLKVLPNPASNYINLVYNTENNASIVVKIIDMSGRLIESRVINSLNSGINSLSFDVSALPSELYNIVISDGQEFRSIRFIKN